MEGPPAGAALLLIAVQGPGGTPGAQKPRRPHLFADRSLAVRRPRAAPAARAWSGHAAAPPSSTMNSRRLFDHLVSARKQRRRYGKAERVGGDQIDDEVELSR